MRRIVFLATWTIAILLASGVCLASLSAAEVSPQAVKKPNFVFILADDMRYDDLKYMPKTRSLVAARGMRFQQSPLSLSACAVPLEPPSVRGQYARQPPSVVQPTTAPQGGWNRPSRPRGYERGSLAPHLRSAGYRTRTLRQVPQRLLRNLCALGLGRLVRFI